MLDTRNSIYDKTDVNDFKFKIRKIYWGKRIVEPIPQFLFHHQISTGIVKVKFREVNVDLLPGTSSGK